MENIVKPSPDQLAHRAAENAKIPFDAEKYAEAMRKLTEHGNSVLNNRFSWFMGSESLLFAALSFSWSNGGPNNLVYVIAGAGLFMALSGFIAVSLSERAYITLSALWKENLAGYKGAPRNGFEIRAVGWRWRLLLPQFLMPIVFLVSWIAVLYIKYRS